jgi:hypothetical protein
MTTEGRIDLFRSEGADFGFELFTPLPGKKIRAGPNTYPDRPKVEGACG